MNIYVARLQAFARRHGGDLLVLGPHAFDRTCVGQWSPHPFSGYVGTNYRKRLIAWCPSGYRWSPRLLGTLVHETWHVFGSPEPPSRAHDATPQALAWELTLIKKIGAPFETLRRHWNLEHDHEPKWFGSWPVPPREPMRDWSRRTFQTWAREMIWCVLFAREGGRHIIGGDGWPTCLRD